MEKPKFYVTCSNLDIRPLLHTKDTKNFVHARQYNSTEYRKLLNFEVGFFDLPQLEAHLILKPFKKFCPFCLCDRYEVNVASPFNSCKEDPLNIKKYYQFYVECSNCKSRGPLKELCVCKLVNFDDKNDPIAIQLKELVARNWAERPEYDLYCESLLSKNKKEQKNVPERPE